VLLGIINVSRRPHVTTGARDSAALGVAIVGFMAAGPMELFLPEAAAIRFGGYVWALLLAFYALCLTLYVLLLRPRLIIYNTTIEQLRPILAQVVSELDREARWAGESLALPQLGVQLHLESFRTMYNAQLIASGPEQSYTGWRRLELSLAEALRETRSRPNLYGYAFVMVGVFLALFITVGMVSQPDSVAQALRDMLRL
jgi:hypothetical protein